MSGKKPSFYHDEPVFGLDIGHSSMKVMQLEHSGKAKPKVLGYGVSRYYSVSAIANGVIVNSHILSEALHELFSKRLIGTINTRRVACTVPTSNTFSRPMKLPRMEKDDITNAVHLEAEQYIPIPVDNLYLDYEISNQDDKGIELLMVAIPKNIIDSTTGFLESIGLEPVVLEPTMNASARIFKAGDPSYQQPTILIDFGSVATDVAVFDKTLFVNSTISGGSDTLTTLIAQRLGVSIPEAFILKSQYGLEVSDQQGAILSAATPVLENLVREVRKIIRYYNDRSVGSKSKISQIVTLGGGANMRGFNEYLASHLNLPSRGLDPWARIDFNDIEQPTELASPLYITVAGEAIISSREIFE